MAQFFSYMTTALTRLQRRGAPAVFPPPPQRFDYDARDYNASDYHAG